MKKYLKIGLFGLITWLVPFVAGFFFYSPDGKLIVDALFFKSIMAIVGTLVGAILLVLYFKDVKQNYLSEGIILGVAWFVINIFLDLIILVPMSQLTIGAYFMQIGLGYLTIPIMSTAMGLVVRNTK